MGFLHQARLLLWKNFTLKKRSPLVLLCELFIPLVLFVILLFIRKRQPATPVDAYRWGSQALPSSGVIPILQSFCEADNRQYNSSDPDHQSADENTRAFLSRLQRVAKQHNFFYPGYTPKEMEKLPSIYKKILDLPAVIRESYTHHAHNFTLEELLSTNTSLQRFLRENISMPQGDIDAFLHSSVSIKEVYRLVFGSYPQSTHTSRVRRSLPEQLQSGHLISNLTLDFLQENAEYVSDAMAQFLPNFRDSLLYQFISEPALWKDKKLMHFLVQMFGDSAGFDPPTILTPHEEAELLKAVVLYPSVLHEGFCNKEEFLRLFNPQPPYTVDDLTDAQERLCNMTYEETEAFSNLLKTSVSEDALISQLHLQPLNLTMVVPELQEFVIDVEKFYTFQLLLYELSDLAASLPQDGCEGMSDGNTTTPRPTPKHPDGTKTTPTPSVDDGTKKVDKFAGLLKFWDGMQKTICGHRPPDRQKDLKPGEQTERSGADDNVSREDTNETHSEGHKHRSKRSTSDLEHLDSFNYGALGLNSGQQKNLKILLHVLYSNPKVLYAPNNTAADDIIRKANETFRLIDSVNVYARKWLTISSDLRMYLAKSSSQLNLEAIKKIQLDLRKRTGLLSILTLNPAVAKFVQLDIPDMAVFLHEIDSIDNAACSWLTLMSGINLNVYKGFQTEWELSNFFLYDQYQQNVSVVAGVVFENIEANKTLPAHIRYKIRQNATFTPTTKRVRDRYWYPGPGEGNYPYYSFGFLWIQDVIERAIINVQVGRDVIEPGTYMQRFPYPCWLSDRFVFMIEHVMPLCLTISWVYSVAMLVQSIVYEKEQRLKEVMKMMGLSNFVHWFAWFITTFTQFSITMAILTAMLKYGHVLTYSNALVVFTTLEVFSLATISFCFLVSTLYSKAKVAAACAGIVYFLTYVPYMYVAIKEDVAGDSINSIVKTLVSLFSTTAFGLGGKYFAFYEEEGVGVQWSNINISPIEDDQFNLLMVIMMMIFDSFLYGLLAWYIENVFPGSYGLPKPWYFPFSHTYWCGGAMRHHEMDCRGLLDLCRRRPGFSIMEEDQACAMDQHPEHASKFEAEPSHLTQGVCIDNLTKVYKTGKKLAVKNLRLNLYEGQITAFLGHNGAGKTTTMSILTGLFPPTSGSALVYGHDIRTDMEVIRQGLGMCPQHNVLFEKLTVEEHLWFYARLKGMKNSDINAEMDSLFEDLGLPEKRKSRIDCLSGGMQRKLSVAIAFVGGSQTVILDEPTAGVDPYARRAIWDLLIRYKAGRTILLSTHHMDEADLLGDRIAIISNGELKCCGSPLFLKNTFCEGYHLNIVKQPADEDAMSYDDIDTNCSSNSQDAFMSKCQESKVTEFIRKYVFSGYKIAESHREIHYTLPYEEAKKGNFEKLFAALESGKDELFVSSYGVADSTLEEVFLEVTENAVKEAEDKENKNSSGSVDSSPATTDSAPSSTPDLPLDDLLDEAAGGQSDHDTSPTTNRKPEIELELGHMFEAANQGEGETEPDDEASQHNDNQINLQRLERARKRSEPDVKHTELYAGKGSYTLSNNWLLLNHFRAMIIKRFHYTTRNWKGLFSQILLPALFVSIAMTVALSAPKDQDPPPIELSPSQYFNLTQPQGNYIPYSNERSSPRAEKYILDAGPDDIIKTFHLPSGVGATCVLNSPFNSTMHQALLASLNISHKTLELLAHYYDEGCERVFIPGIRLENYVPQASIITDSTKMEKTRSTAKPTGSSETVRYYPHCVCKGDNSGYKCSNDGFSHPPEYKVVTQDVLQDITSDEKSQLGDFYLYTTDEYRLHRYGAFSFGTERAYIPDDFGKDSPSLFRTIAVRGSALAWYNNKGYHSMPVYLNTLNNAILRANLPKSKGNPAAYGITVTNHPMNKTNNQLNMNYILQGADVLISIFIIAAMSFVPASFVVFLVYERSSKAKHLQFVSGLNPIMYWLANYVWDLCNYMIPALCIVVILLAFDIPAYVSQTNLPAVVALFLLYGWSMTPIMYPASFKFDEPSTAYIFLIVINLFTGITCIVSSFLLEIFSYDKDLSRVHNILKDVFLMFPNYCLGRGLMDIAFNEYRNEFYFKTGQYDKMKSPFEWELTSRKLVVMAVMGVLFFIITLLCEYRFFIKSSIHVETPRGRQHKYVAVPTADEDVDVAAERRRVLRGTGKKDLLRLENLTKVYKSKTRKQGCHLAVDRLCVGVPEGECFGLLGVNGAGKTTTFKMLTGDIIPTSGDAFLNRYSVLRDMLKVQQNIGYCPQFDALFDELTAREHLRLYARLRGVPPSEEKQVVEWALTKLGLISMADKPSGTYSGGNKRKLSTAVTLIGHPPLIFMDEPTTGMDPHSRRYLWDLILNLIKDGRSVILTSHSMEECEALCTRLAIMVNGKFKCLGSIQHLKNKYGDGYTFSLRLKGPNYERAMRQAQRFVNESFPEATVKECHYNLLQFEIKCQTLSLSYVFAKMEEAQKDLLVEDYSVSQNNLDNVFINFVKQQMEIVHEEDSQSNPKLPPRKTRATSSVSEASATNDDSDGNVRHVQLTSSEMQLETEDDDEPLLDFDATGTRLTMLPMDPVIV